MDIDEKFQLIKRNTQEIVTEDELKELLKTKKNPAVYLGTAITGKPHVAYYFWVLKLADFLKAGFKVKLLLSDITGACDNTPWDLLEARYQYYSIVVRLMFESIGMDTKELEFVKASDYSGTKEYFLDLIKLSSLTSVHDARKAGSEVVKASDNPKLAGLIYPLLQTIDEEHLGVDVQLGGVDQRKILMFARESNPKIGYRSRVEVMFPMIPGLVGKKMSASKPESKIDVLDEEDVVKKKLSKAFCPEGETEDNGVLAMFKYLIMTLKGDKGESLMIKRPEKFGGDVEYETYEQLEKDFVEKKLHPMDLKNALADEINGLIRSVRDGFKGNEELIDKAYPE